MPGKIVRSAPRPSIGLPELLVAIHTSRQSCSKAEKARIFTPVQKSSEESWIMEETMADIKTISRRTLVKTGIGVLAAPAVLRVLPAQAQSQVIKIGHVSPKTGPLAGFGEADGYILEQVRGILSKGLSNGGKTYKVEIISKDSQSNASRASEVASELTLGDKVNLIVASATPDTTNPVSDQAEVNEVLCVPKTSSVLISRRNRLASAHHDRATMFRTGRLGRAIQVEDPA